MLNVAEAILNVTEAMLNVAEAMLKCYRGYDLQYTISRDAIASKNQQCRQPPKWMYVTMSVYHVYKSFLFNFRWCHREMDKNSHENG